MKRLLSSCQYEKIAVGTEKRRQKWEILLKLNQWGLASDKLRKVNEKGKREMRKMAKLLNGI